MQLAFDAVDRLVELLEERRAPLPAVEAARHLLALRQAPEGLARGLVEQVVAGDARIVWRGGCVDLARGLPDPPLEQAAFVVFDLETTGLSAASARICEIGAVRVEALELVDRYQTLVRPGVPLPPPISDLTGLRDEELRRAPPVGAAVRRFIAFAGDAVFVAHNARFDVSFLDRQLVASSGRRLSGPVVDTVSLARCLLTGRGTRHGLAALSHFFGTSARPCHRALPDAEATAEILVALIGLAQERGARTVSDLCALATPRAAGAREARPRPRRAEVARRLPVPRPPRAGALRREGARPAATAALLLRERAAAAGGGGGARRGRADRVAVLRLGGRGGARGAAADPGAAAARERAAGGARAGGLPAAPGRDGRRLVAPVPARADPKPAAGRAGGARARSRDGRGARAAARGRAAPAAAREDARPLRLPALRRRGAVT